MCAILCLIILAELTSTTQINVILQNCLLSQIVHIAVQMAMVAVLHVMVYRFAKMIAQSVEHRNIVRFFFVFNKYLPLIR